MFVLPPSFIPQMHGLEIEILSGIKNQTPPGFPIFRITCWVSSGVPAVLMLYILFRVSRSWKNCLRNETLKEFFTRKWGL
jgi:hypothetical protein